MNRIDSIITEAINNQVNLGKVKGYRDGIARVANDISNNQQWMQNPVIADMQNYGLSIVNAYDKGNVGDINNPESYDNKVFYRSNSYGDGLGTSMVNGMLTDLGRAGYSQLTSPLQNAVYDFRRGYYAGKNWMNRNFGGNNTQKQAPQQKQQNHLMNNTLMQLLEIREEKYKEFSVRSNTLPPMASRLIAKMFEYINNMYYVLSGQPAQQSAQQMQAGQQAQQRQQQAQPTGNTPAQGTVNTQTQQVRR